MIHRCHTCPRARYPVLPSGPVPARVLFIGEQPSYNEDSQGIPFVGRTGQELDHTYLPLANLPRSTVHIANARYCSHEDYRNPTPEEAIACSSVHLGELLSRVKPQVIVPMGAIACSLFHGIQLTKDHGIPRPGKWGGWKGIVFPTYHPTYGMRTTSMMIPLMDDFHRLGKLLGELDRGEFHYPVDPHPTPDYRVCRSPLDLTNYLIGHNDYLACDTESLPDGSTYCVTISHTPGTGRLIYVRDKATMDIFRQWLTNATELLLFHNYLHDVTEFEKLELPIHNFRDTMVMAYELCIGGGGDEEDSESKAGRGSLSLKILAYRHLAITMTSFKDTVYPHSVPHLQSYLDESRTLLTPDAKVKRCTCGCPQMAHELRGKTQRPLGKCSLCGCTKCKLSKSTAQDPDTKKLTLLHRKLGGLMEAMKNGKALDPWKRVKEWHEWDLEVLGSIMGPVPRPSIEYVPEAELLGYACKDADATLRLYLLLKDLRPWLFY